MMFEKEKYYDPLPMIVDQFMWAIENIQKFKGTSDEKKIYQIAQHNWKEIEKYIYEK